MLEHFLQIYCILFLPLNSPWKSFLKHCTKLRTNHLICLVIITVIKSKDFSIFDILLLVPLCANICWSVCHWTVLRIWSFFCFCKLLGHYFWKKCYSWIFGKKLLSQNVLFLPHFCTQKFLCCFWNFLIFVQFCLLFGHLKKIVKL